MGMIRDTAARLGLLTRADAAAETGEMPVAIRPPARSAVSDPLSLDAVYRAISVLQTGASQLTIDVWRGPAQLERPGWLEAPDPWRPGTVWLDETIASLALSGNAYWLVQRAPDDRGIVALTILDPADVTIQVPASQTGPNLFHVAGRTYTARDVAHLALMRRPGRRTPYGLGPIQAARQSVEGAARLRQWADQWIDQSAAPSGALTMDEPLTAEQAKDLKTQFMSSVHTGEPVVLGLGAKFSPFALAPDDMQFIETQQFNVTAIARLFGIPPRLMLAAIDGGSQTYSNQSQEDLSFVRWTLMAYLREIETAVSWLLPRGQSARFNLDAILRADTKTRYESHQIGLNAGFLTVPDVRAIEGLPPTEPDPVPVPTVKEQPDA